MYGARANGARWPPYDKPYSSRFYWRRLLLFRSDQSKAVFIDDAVNPAVTRAAKLRGSIGSRTSITHLDEKFDD